MSTVARAEPWREVPAEVADVIEPRIDAIAAEILAAIPREVPEYARPFEGSFGRGVRTGVGEALRQFVSLVRDPDAGRPGREVYVALGRGELRQGRTLDSLQAAYRVGARVAWREVAAAGREAGLDAEALSLVAEAIFAYIDELSADSVEGYSRAQAESEGERQRRRRELVELLLREPAAADADLRAAAEAAGVRLPARAAAIACGEDDLGRLARGLPADALTTVIDELGCAIVPDPEGPGRAGEIERAASEIAAAIGPAGALAGLPASWALAREALRLPAGVGLVHADERLAGLLVAAAPAVAARLEARRLAPFDGLTDKARERLEKTALAFVQQQGNAAAMARALHVHPQTARYRLARLRELLGDDLDDADARFELEAALRAAGVVVP